MSAVTLAPRRLRPFDLARVGSIGLRTRKLRAALSALGIAMGVAAIVAVLGLSSSSQAGLLAEIDRLGTNLLTASSGQDLAGDTAELPVASPNMIGRIGPVTDVESIGDVDVDAYRSPLVPAVKTNGLNVQAASVGLVPAVGTTVAQGSYINGATATQPVAVLGASAARRLGIDRIYPGIRIWVGDHWFYVVGILAPAPLAPEIDTAVLMGFAAAQTYLGFDGHPSTVYVRAETDQVEAVRGVLAETAKPSAPSEVEISRPSDTLVARRRPSRRSTRCSSAWVRSASWSAPSGLPTSWSSRCSNDVRRSVCAVLSARVAVTSACSSSVSRCSLRSSGDSSASPRAWQPPPSMRPRRTGTS